MILPPSSQTALFYLPKLPPVVVDLPKGDNERITKRPAKP